MFHCLGHCLRNMIGWFMKTYLHKPVPWEKSKMFNITWKYLSIFNNKPPTIRVAHVTRDFLTYYSCLYYSSMVWQKSVPWNVFAQLRIFKLPRIEKENILPIVIKFSWNTSKKMFSAGKRSCKISLGLQCWRHHWTHHGKPLQSSTKESKN